MKSESYRILLDEDWELEDLYEFPHALYQCYAFIYCLDAHIPAQNRIEINNALLNYPWRGGFSYVNIYKVLKDQIPASERPKIKAMQKSSPGWLDLSLNVDVAYQVATAVTIFAGAALAVLEAYKRGNQILQNINADRKKAGLARLNASASDLKAVNAISLELAKNLGFKSIKELQEATGDPEVTMKLLMAHYRRMKVLLEYGQSGKATLTLPFQKEE